MIGTRQSEVALQRLVDEREGIQRKQDSKLAEINHREDPMPNEGERELLKGYRDELAVFDSQILERSAAVEADRIADERSRDIRRATADGAPGVDVTDDGIVYRDFYSYGREFVLTRSQTLAAKWTSGEDERNAMKLRQDLVKRVPANTLSSNVAGLTPAQHINQIFQVIDKSRPLVASATRADLDRGQLTYPLVATRPVVAVQGTEKTEAGNTGMSVTMQTANASVYLGGGDLSWQAINWSTPNALQLWFDLAAADYALKTEQDAAQALQHSAFSYNIATTIAGTPTFAQLMTAVGAGYAEVFANSGRLPDTLYVAPDRYGYILGLTSDAFSQFVNVSQQGIGPFRTVISRGMDAGVVVVGDSSALLVAETPGAPVELRVTEPAIGGVEVGLIGAFEAVVVDPGAFAMLTTAS
jgi:hypothetical protein